MAAARVGLVSVSVSHALHASSSSPSLRPPRLRLPPYLPRHHHHLLPTFPPNYPRPSSAAAARLRASATMSQAAGNPYAAELAAAKKAVTLAARLCQAVQKDILQSGVQSKADQSPVTVADYGSQILVSLVLKMEAPASSSFSMVAEEDSEELRKEGAEEILENITELVNETIVDDGTYSIYFSKEGILSAIDDGKSEGGPSGRHWVLDPIDGTKGGDQYAIALALLDEGKVVLGVLACPNLSLGSIGNLNGGSSGDQVGALFSATIGCGAEVESLQGSPAQKISVCSIDNPVEASFFESYEGAHSLRDLTGSIAEVHESYLGNLVFECWQKLGVQAPPVRIDSQAKYGALARGDGAIYLRFPHKGYREKIWDHAAGSIVVTEAGGLVTDASGNDLDFSKGRFLDLDTGIIATNKQLMPSLLKAVQDAIKEQNQAASPL
uniref:3'(2'),5'-bisphosphate nucleotidase n=1 Tax=Oryza nivara TaxID=4536 RepID=A0A0E0ILX1_ORYNI